MVHHGHNRILVPPVRVLNPFDLTLQDDNLAGRYQLARAKRGSKMLRNTISWYISVEGLRQSVDKLCSLTSSQNVGGIRGEDIVPIEVDHEGVRGSSIERAALGGDTEYVRARLLNEVPNMASVNDGDVQATPLKNSHTEADSFGSDGEYCWIMTLEDDSPSW